MSFYITDPAGEALLSRQRHLNEGSADLRFFAADVSPFISVSDWAGGGLRRQWSAIPPQRNFFVMVAQQVLIPEEAEILLTLPLFQMHCPRLIPQDLPEANIRVLHQDDLPAMLDLTARTKPGPFYARTPLMGDYIGLFAGEKLVAMAGERLKTPGHTEVSAICTDPDFLGRGYASAMTTRVCAQIMHTQCQPFLHVRQDNTRATAVYRKLGFEIRSEVYFAIFRKN